MTNEEVTIWYKERVKFYESTVKDVKQIIQTLFKEHKDWTSKGVTEEEVDWYKGFVRELKNDLESGYKECILEYKNHKEGLNPPYCYRKLNRK
jgi:uncharacterized protein YacL (UPF0231 family)